MKTFLILITLCERLSSSLQRILTMYVVIMCIICTNSYAQEDCDKYNESMFLIGYINSISKQLCRTSNSLEALEKQGLKTKVSLFGRK